MAGGRNMRHNRLALWMFVAGVVTTPLLAAPEAQEAEPPRPKVPGAAIDLREDEQVRIRVGRILCNIRREEALKDLEEMGSERVAAALGYELLYGKYGVSTLRFIAGYYRRDVVLPYLDACFRQRDGPVLMEAARTAEAWNDPRLLAPLIEKALDGRYVEINPVPTEKGMEIDYRPVFGEVARAMYVISKGQVGTKEPPRAFDYAKRDALRSQSGAAGAEPPPSRGETITTVKPPEDKKTGEEKAPPKEDSTGGATDPPPAKP
jgi:hypothetical protein